MQLHWGHKLGIAIAIFISAMLAMVFYAARQSNEMIDENYYQKELVYQSVIEAQKNLLRVSSNNIVTQDMDEVIILLPEGTFAGFDSGAVALLRNDAERLDVRVNMEDNGSNRTVIPKSRLSAGMYRARIRWSSGGIPYYKEESVFVEKQR